MKKISIGIIGFGNIGSSVAEVIKKNSALILEHTGIELHIVRICDIQAKRSAYPYTKNAEVIINDPKIDVVVEAIGGVNPALKYILAAIANKKHVVTPNKEVVAKHMPEILAAARKNRVQFLFEGAVGGGIPILMPLKECLAANRISEVYGIVNGTTNYILSKMMQEGIEFSEALKQAQVMGYAEPNPESDIKGYDASYKAAILASTAYGALVNWQDVYCEGIERIGQEDIQYAKEIGYVIKLLAIAKMAEGKLDVRVHPALIPHNHPLASVSENYNAIYVKGDPVGQLMFYGPGAGGGPTASAVISDILATANLKFKNQNLKLRKYRIQKIDEIVGRYYIRLQAPDKFGVLAGISKAFARKKVSIAAVVQKETVGNLATIVILIHSVSEKNLRAALSIIEKLPVVRKVSNVIRMI